ncbi:FG-GAP-like repeat-containing protein [candidate division KSB1 bacterium]
MGFTLRFRFKGTVGLLSVILLISAYAVSAYGAQEIIFEDVASEAQVAFVECDTDSLLNQMWGAPSWSDYDNDGDWDLAVTNEGHNRLFRNEGNGRFSDVTRPAGLWDDSGMGMQMSFADFDNDGDQDIYLTNMMSFNILYRNNGDGTFTDITGPAGVKLPGGAASGYCVGDYDSDGFLDMYVTVYLNGPWGVFYRNNGDMTFRDVSEQVGSANNGMEMTALFVDYDNDGDLDIYHLNDFDIAHVFYRNNGNGTFTDVSVETGLNHTGAAMGACAGDLNNDGFLDFYIGNFTEDTALLSDSDGIYHDISDRFIISDPEPGQTEPVTMVDVDSDVNWGVVMFDLDNDGDLDIFASGGSVMGPTDYGNFLWLNDGDGNFRDISEAAGVHDIEGTSRGAAVADYDGDGDLDLYVVNIDEAPNRLYRNRTFPPYNWLDVKLEGILSNKDAIGSRVYLYAGDMFQMRDLTCGTNYMADDYRRVHFGLKDKTRVDSIVVRWPSGFRNVLYDVEPNQTVELTETQENQGPAPKISLLSQNQPNPFVMTSTTIQYQLSRPGRVTIRIYNILGQEVMTLVDEDKPVGKYTIRWNATDKDRRRVASGLYFYRLETADYSETRRMVYLR